MIRTRAVAAAISVALVFVLGACGDSDESAGPTKEGPTKEGTTSGSSASAVYVGLSKSAAIARAEADDRPWRIAREDDELSGVTQDFVEERVTFEIDDGKVTTATFG